MKRAEKQARNDALRAAADESARLAHWQRIVDEVIAEMARAIQAEIDRWAKGDEEWFSN
jgi:predicted nucleic acid-binding Zn ribbon protein